MKSTLLLIALVLLGTAPDSHSLPASASESVSSEDHISLLRLDLRARKAEIVLESMELTVDEAAKFVEIYSEYDRKLSALSVERIGVIRNLAEHFASMDDTMARDLRKTTIDLTRKRLDLLEKTAEKVDKALSSLLAVRFVQIENQLLLMIDVQIANELPLIPREALMPN